MAARICFSFDRVMVVGLMCTMNLTWSYGARDGRSARRKLVWSVFVLIWRSGCGVARDLSPAARAR